VAPAPRPGGSDDDVPAGACGKQSGHSLLVPPGASATPGRPLRLSAAGSNYAKPATITILDAAHVDVYAGAHVVVALLDVRSKPSWAYVKKLLPKVPRRLPIIVLSNFRDVADGGGRVVMQREVDAHINEFLAQEGSASVKGASASGRRVHAFECSLLDCFGLKTLYNAFNVRTASGGFCALAPLTDRRGASSVQLFAAHALRRSRTWSSSLLLHKPRSRQPNWNSKRCARLQFLQCPHA
jgi:hypothetical protein